MKMIFLLYLIDSILSPKSVSNNVTNTECQIVNFYREVDARYHDAKAITTNKYIESIEKILLPTIMDSGKFVVNVTRKETNYYKIESTDLWIETTLCLELALWQEVVLIVESPYGYMKGRIIFD